MSQRSKPRSRPARAPRAAPVATLPRAPFAGALDWKPSIEAFLAQRAPRRPELVREVLMLSLISAPSWGAFVDGRWVTHACMRVYEVAVPGFADARTLALLERFVRWLGRRGELTTWTRDTVLGAIDEVRWAGGRDRRGAAVLEYRLAPHEVEPEARAFAATTGPDEQGVAYQIARRMAHVVGVQLGVSGRAALGCIDPHAEIADALAESDAQSWAPRYFATAARYYEWLAATHRLDARRARWIATRFASVALGFRRAAA